MLFRPPFLKIALLPLLAATLPVAAEDWPMWRFDAARTASSPEILPDELHLAWSRQYPAREQVWDDPLNHDLMPYDKLFEPVVLGTRMFIGFNDSDKLAALDLATGDELWTYFTGGPVRLPPVAWEGKVFITSDDGCLHCVAAEDGKPLWTFRGGPSAQKVLGNERIISAWPARGGAVIRDGRVYFAASIWPFMGTFLHALDAATGKVLWTNDGSGADFIKQPHSAPSFAGVAPQGAMVATENLLLVPGGRSVPAAFNRQTGALEFFRLADGGKGNGGSFVAAGKDQYYVHTRLRGVRSYQLATGEGGDLKLNEPVIDGSRLFAADDAGKNGPAVRALDGKGKEIWSVAADGTGDLIRAGNCLYAAGAKSLSAIALPNHKSEKPQVVWTLPVQGKIQRLLAANGHLIAVTDDGRILAYGRTAGTAAPLADKPEPLAAPSAEALAVARTLLEKVEDKGGHALVFGAEDGVLSDALLSLSEMQVTVVAPDAAKVEVLRRRYDGQGIYGRRISVHEGDPVSFQAPPYIAHLVIIGSDMADRMQEPAMLRAAFESVRPYGGTLWWQKASGKLAAQMKTGDFEQATIEEQDGHLTATREGSLPGAADWTHQYGDIGNTVKSNDTRVRAPLGVLWFGGNSNLDVLPRHGHGPPQMVVGGRLFIQGMNSLSARDVYTGRVIWKHDFKDLGTFGIYYNETYADTPLSTEYNQKHIPGANGRGSNYAATADAVYMAVHGECQVLDARSGKLRQRIPLREGGAADEKAQWGFIGIYDDLLIGGDDFAHYSLRLGEAENRAQSVIDDYSASGGLAVFDRNNGKLLWRTKARHSFLHNAIVAGNGRIYCIDRLTAHAEGLLKRRGKSAPADYRVVAFDERTGDVVWQLENGVFGTWLGYSAQHDILLQAGAKASDRLSGEIGEGMITYRGKDGSLVWQDLKRKYTGPCILHNDLIFTGANSYESSGGGFELFTGKPHLVTNPLTGKQEPWRVNRTYGCNTIVASEHLLTFRSGAAGFYDLDSMSGTGNLGGFKSGCTSNLIVANGVLNAPDYTRTCSCAYQNQTSLALIHMPEMEMWTFSQFGLDGRHGDRILKAGINFGAPGNRRAADGTLWLEHPHAGTGNAPQLGVEGMVEQARFFRRHSSQVSEGSEGYAWVAASGLIGAGEIVLTPSLRRPLLVKPAKAARNDDDDEGSSKGKPGSKSKAGSKSKSAEQPPPPPQQEPLLKIDYPPIKHTVRLHFAEPEGLRAGQRVFDVTLQGKRVIQGLDIAREADAVAGAPAAVVREFRGVVIGADLRIGLHPAPGSKAPPVLCGVEFAAEEPNAAALRDASGE